MRFDTFLPFLLILGLVLVSLSGLFVYIGSVGRTKWLDSLVSLGAGSMLTLALVHILPEALEADGRSIFAFMVGFAAMYVLEELLTPSHTHHKHCEDGHHDEEERSHVHHVSLVAFLAISAHTILDGIGIGAGFATDPKLGILILIGVSLHQIPVSLSLGALLRQSDFSTSKQVLALLAFALAAPLGIGLSKPLIASSTYALAPLLTALAGGSLLYVATADLLPLVHRKQENRWLIVPAFLIGIVCMVLIKGLE